MAARAKAWVRGRSLSRIVSSNYAGSVDVFVGGFVLSGRGLCGEPITHLEDLLRIKQPSRCIRYLKFILS